MSKLSNPWTTQYIIGKETHYWLSQNKDLAEHAKLDRTISLKAQPDSGLGPTLEMARLLARPTIGIEFYDDTQKLALAVSLDLEQHTVLRLA